MNFDDEVVFEVVIDTQYEWVFSATSFHYYPTFTILVIGSECFSNCYSPTTGPWLYFGIPYTSSELTNCPWEISIVGLSSFNFLASSAKSPVTDIPCDKSII